MAVEAIVSKLRSCVVRGLMNVNKKCFNLLYDARWEGGSNEERLSGAEPFLIEATVMLASDKPS